MKQLIILPFIIFSLALLGCKTTQVKNEEPSLPPPPTGFTWYESAKGIGSFLKPNGWHVKEETEGDTNALFISKENITEKGKFTTGLSVNQINSWSNAKKSKPSQYAKAFAAQMSKKGEVLKSNVVRGNFPDMNIVRIKTNNEGTNTITHHISIGMDDRDQLYLLSFEAPESEWETETEHSAPMLNFFFLGN